MTRPSQMDIAAAQNASLRLADRDTPFVMNDWYVAAFGDDITHQLLARTLLGEPVVFYRDTQGQVVALADKLETLVGMFGIGNLPTGDKDPFALRRHALGVIRMLSERNLPLGLNELLELAINAFPEALRPVPVLDALSAYIYDRLSGSLREQGFSAQEVDAVLALQPKRLGEVSQRLEAVRAFAALPEASALAAANKRIGNILKKVDAVDGHVSDQLLKEAAEIALFEAMKVCATEANQKFEAGDYSSLEQQTETG